MDKRKLKGNYPCTNNQSSHYGLHFRYPESVTDPQNYHVGEVHKEMFKLSGGICVTTMYEYCHQLSL